mgnify:CR=1 FL=1
MIKRFKFHKPPYQHQLVKFRWVWELTGIRKVKPLPHLPPLQTPNRFGVQIKTTPGVSGMVMVLPPTEIEYQIIFVEDTTPSAVIELIPVEGQPGVFVNPSAQLTDETNGYIIHIDDVED